MRKVLKWLSISVATITGIVAVAFLLFFYLLTPARLTPIVNNYCSESLNAKIDFDSVQVSIFEEFPMVSIKLVGGEILSYALQSDTVRPAGTDTLLRFNEFMLSLNIIDLMQSKVNIRRVRISQPQINAYISPSGCANWDIYSSAETTATETKIALNIDRFSIRGPASLTYISCPDSISAQASIGRLFARGNFTPDIEHLTIDRLGCSDIKIKANIENDAISAGICLDSASVNVVEPRREYDLMIKGMVSATIEKQVYCDSLPVQLNGTLGIDPANEHFFGFRNLGFTLANLPELKLNGGVILSDGTISSDLNLRIESLALQSLLALVPDGVSDEIGKVTTNIKVSLNTSIKGVYEYEAKGKLPIVDMRFKIPSGHLIYKDLESKIDDVAMDASFHFDPASPENTGVRFNTIHIESHAITLKGNANVANLFDDPNVTLNLNGEANLQELLRFAPEDLGISARGIVHFQASGSFRMSCLSAQDIAKNDLMALFMVDNLRVRIPKDTVSLFAMKTSLELNTTQTRVNRRNTNTVSRLLSVALKSDTARVRLPSREIIALSKVDLSMRSSESILSGDTARVIPMLGNITARNLEYSTIDSTAMRLRDVKTNFRILPSRENRSLPTLRFDIESQQFSLYAEGTRLGLRDASISLIVNKNKAPSQRQQGRTPQRQRNRSADDFAGEDFDLKANAEISSLLREWNVDGTIKSRTGRVVSPYFPLRTRLQNMDVAFTTADITLHDSRISCGKSQFIFTGKIEGIRRALLAGRGLQITADIKADTLNVNELLAAIYNGTTYSETSDSYKQAIAAAQDEEELEKIIQEENENKEELATLLVVPSNMSVDIQLDIDYGKYADITIHKMTGALISRDRCLQLKDIIAVTDVGEIDMTALYASRSRKDISFGMDMEFKNIQVENFIRLIPSIDSLIPMLSSFKGIVNCQLAATAAMDSTMNILLPSLNAACRISGKDMVLLDGATFAKIANTLKFKNRRENLVDSIAIEMLVRNNQIEIFPFIMQMDRYQTAISGIHQLDMTFDYHISVLKSPLPFMIGLNLSGNLDDMDRMKMNIGKARYKDTHLPTYVTVIDTTRLNLRSQINNIVLQGVDLARFSQFSTPSIDSTLLEKDIVFDPLSAADSLALYREGIIEVMPSVLPDSISSDNDQPRRRRSRNSMDSAVQVLNRPTYE